MQFSNKMVKIVCGVLAVAIVLPIVISAIAMFN